MRIQLFDRSGGGRDGIAIGRRAAWLAAIVAALLFPGAAAAVSPAVRTPTAEEKAAKPYFDSRVQAARASADRAASSKARAAQAALRADLGAQGVVDVDALTGTPRVIQRLDGTLTGPAGGGPVAIARRWARANRAALGLSGSEVDALRLDRRTTAPRYGLTHLLFQQRYRRIPAFDNGLRVSVARDGRILSVSGSPLADPAVRSVDPRIGARAAMRSLQRNVDASGQAEVVSGPEAPAGRPASPTAASPAWCSSAPPAAPASPGIWPTPRARPPTTTPSSTPRPARCSTART